MRVLSEAAKQILETNSQRDEVCLIEANTLTQTLSLTHSRVLAGHPAGQKLKHWLINVTCWTVASE